MEVFNTLGVPENEQIQHKMLTSAIEKAQQKIEANNYGIRKNLLEYDQVMNEQREIIYAERRRVLDGESMRDTIYSMITEYVENMTDRFASTEVDPEEWDIKGFEINLHGVIPQMELPSEEEMMEDTTEEQTDQLEQIKSLTDVKQNVQNIEVEKRNPIKEITEKIKSFVQLTYSCGYVQLYGVMRAGWLIKFTLLAVILTLINMTVKVVRFREFPFEMYAGITFASVLFMILYAAPFLGLPEIIAGSRLCLTEQILLLSMMALSVDEIFFLLSKTKAERLFPCLTLIGVAGIYAGTNYFGVYHGYLYYELTRYNSVVELTNEIIKKYPQYNYTIISTTEELYQVIEDGRHEELLDFHNKSKQDKYIIPTEYLFFYVEKNPIEYAQYHFFDGPRWLAQAKYIPNYKYSTAILSEGDDIKHSKIAEKYVDNSLEIMGKASDAYTNIKNRRILESEVYYWCQEFKKRFPNEIKVYYEDEDFICYIVKQNPEHLYDLGI